MDVRTRRRNNDLERLKRLRDEHPHIISRLAVAGSPTNRVKLTLSMPTAGSEAYPDEIETHVDMEIQLPAEYPDSPPHVHVSSRVWNPNVYVNGLVCIGPVWIPSEGMDLFLVKMIRILAFDPQIVNPGSPANFAAAKWYEKRRLEHPKSFPTFDLKAFLVEKRDEKPGPRMTWTNLK